MPCNQRPTDRISRSFLSISVHIHQRYNASVWNLSNAKRSYQMTHWTINPNGNGWLTPFSWMIMKLIVCITRNPKIRTFLLRVCCSVFTFVFRDAPSKAFNSCWNTDGKSDVLWERKRTLKLLPNEVDCGIG